LEQSGTHASAKEMLEGGAIRAHAAIVVLQLRWTVQHQFVKLARVGVVGLCSRAMRLYSTCRQRIG